MKGTILVTGSIGTVGSEVVKQLASSSLGYGVIKVTVHSQDKAHKILEVCGIKTKLVLSI